MTVQEWLWTLLTSAGTGTFFAGAIVYLTKGIISHRLEQAIKLEYDQKLETLKSQLAAQNNADLERLKGQLQVAAAERSIRLTAVYERTVDAAAGTYERLLNFKTAVERYASVSEKPHMGTKAQRRKIVAEKGFDLESFYHPRKPFLPAETVMNIDGLLYILRDTFVDFYNGVEMNTREDLAEADKAIDQWQECHRTLTKEVPQILRFLENDIRKLLGIYSNSDTPKV